MDWLRQKIFGKEEINYENLEKDMERDAQIRSIRRRIKEFKENLGSPEPKFFKKPTKAVDQKIDTEKEKRNKELSDIKAKLTGRK